MDFNYIDKCLCPRPDLEDLEGERGLNGLLW